MNENEGRELWRRVVKLKGCKVGNRLVPMAWGGRGESNSPLPADGDLEPGIFSFPPVLLELSLSISEGFFEFGLF